jgi:glutamate-1-semialdehyde 2,1-aminomutase
MENLMQHSVRDDRTAQALKQRQRTAEEFLPGGVAGSARFNPVLGYALTVSRASGGRIYDITGKEYIDFNLAHGAAFLGHGHLAVRQALLAALDSGVISGYETEQNLVLARKICEIIPCAQMVRLANSGTEGTMLALRLARAYTGKPKLLKFWGHFHGLHDYVMYNAHSPLAPVSRGSRVTLQRESAGIPAVLDQLVEVIPWQDEDALLSVVRQQGDQIGAIMMEPINYNSGGIVASKAYMEFVRRLASEHNIVLIYDEVLSAFRTGVSCAQGYYGVTPDVCVISKAISNGLPLAVVAGRREIMSQVTPFGEVTHSGTTTGNLISVSAALACLEEITSPGFYDHIYSVAEHLYSGLSELFMRAEVPARVQGVGARFGLFFGFTHEVKNFTDTLKHDGVLASQFLRACARNGVYFHSYGTLASGHHGIASAHTIEDVDEALNRIEDALRKLS